MNTPSAIDKFGKFIVEHLRDKGIEFAEGLIKNHWKAPALLEMQDELAHLNSRQKETFLKAITQTIDVALHDFLFALQEEDEDNGIRIIVDNQNIAPLSDGLHGEAYTDDGWYAKFSKYPSLD